jgi:hypothetical protein
MPSAVPSSHVQYSISTGYNYEATSAPASHARVSSSHPPPNDYRRSLGAPTDVTHSAWHRIVSRTNETVNGGARHRFKAQPVGGPDIRYAPYSASPSHCGARSARRSAVPSSSAFRNPSEPASAIAVAEPLIHGCWPNEHAIADHAPLERTDDGIDDTQQWRAQTRCDPVFSLRSSTAFDSSLSLARGAARAPIVVHFISDSGAPMSKLRYLCPNPSCLDTFTRDRDAQRHYVEVHLRKRRKPPRSSMKNNRTVCASSQSGALYLTQM